jgi:hypothetical protein
MLQIDCTRLESFEASVISTLGRYCTNCQILRGRLHRGPITGLKFQPWVENFVM